MKKTIDLDLIITFILLAIVLIAAAIVEVDILTLY